MFVPRRVLSILSALMASAAPAAAGGAVLKPQYVLISFDGAGVMAQWPRSFDLAEKSGARFTYFLSCVFLLPKEDRKGYQPPGMAAGRSNVGFAHDRDEVAERLEWLWKAHLAGHEIGSHGCGHFDGASWSKKDWLAEFDAFTSIAAQAWQRYGPGEEPADWQRFVSEDIRGFRAPYLATGSGLFAALAERGFAYDASGVTRGPAEPDKSENPVRFGLPQIPEGPGGRRVIAMDYNLFVRHSAGFETADSDGAFEQRTYEAFTDAFEREYRGGRAPLQLGFHFTLMNGAAYWRALERFAVDVCGKPQVVCTSYADYLSRTRLDHTRPATAGIGG